MENRTDITNADVSHIRGRLSFAISKFRLIIEHIPNSSEGFYASSNLKDWAQKGKDMLMRIDHDYFKDLPKEDKGRTEIFINTLSEIKSDCCGKPIIKDFMSRDGVDYCSKCLALVTTKSVSNMRAANQEELITRAHFAIAQTGEAIEPLESPDKARQLEFALLCAVQALERQTPKLASAENRVSILKKLFEI